MLVRVLTFFFGPFWYPVYFASFLHVIDFFTNIALTKSINSEGDPPLPRKLRGGFQMATCIETKEIRKTW
jgi:hypothetical protein